MMRTAVQLGLYRPVARSDDASVVSHRPSSPPSSDGLQALFDALTTLRGVQKLDDPRWKSAWDAVRDFLSKLWRPGYGLRIQRDDVEQETLVKIFRNVAKLEATTPEQAAAWVKRIHRNTVYDASRRHNTDPLGRRRQHDEQLDPLERLPSPEKDGVERLDPAALEEERQKFFDALEDFLEATVKNHRQRAERYRWSESAYAVYVLERPHDEVRQQCGPVPSVAAFAQRLHRARTKILLPLCQQLLAEHEVDTPSYRFVATLDAIFCKKERADAGKPRPNRKKSGGSS